MLYIYAQIAAGMFIGANILALALAIVAGKADNNIEEMNL